MECIVENRPAVVVSQDRRSHDEQRPKCSGTAITSLMNEAYNTLTYSLNEYTSLDLKAERAISDDATTSCQYSGLHNRIMIKLRPLQKESRCFFRSSRDDSNISLVPKRSGGDGRRRTMSRIHLKLHWSLGSLF